MLFDKFLCIWKYVYKIFKIISTRHPTPNSNICNRSPALLRSNPIANCTPQPEAPGSKPFKESVPTGKKTPKDLKMPKNPGLPPLLALWPPFPHINPYLLPFYPKKDDLSSGFFFSGHRFSFARLPGNPMIASHPGLEIEYIKEEWGVSVPIYMLWGAKLGAECVKRNIKRETGKQIW